MASTAKSTLMITGITALGLGLSFLSNIVTAASFGAGWEMDAFLSASTLPIFLVTLFSGCLHSTFLPVYIEMREKGDAQIGRVVSSLFNAMVLGSLLLVFAAALAAEPIMALLAPGFSPEAGVQSAHLLRLLMPVLAFTVAGEMASFIMYAQRIFFLPTAMKAIGPLLTMAFVLLFSKSMSTASLAFASLVFAAVQALALIAGAMALKPFRYSLCLDFGNPMVGRLFRLMAPILAAMLFTKCLPLFDRWVGSHLPSGSITVLSYAYKLLMSVQPILISGISVTLYPALSEFAARGDLDQMQARIIKGIQILFITSLPCVVLVALLGEPLTLFLFHRGSFDLEAARDTHRAFAFYLLSLPAALAGGLISQGFYVLRQTKILATLGILETFGYILLSVGLLPFFGLFAIPLAYSIYFTLSAILLFYLLMRRIPSLHPQVVLSCLLQCVLAACLSLGLGYSLKIAIPQALIGSIAAISASAIAYLALLVFVLKVPEALIMKDKISQRVGRLWPRFSAGPR